MSSDQKDLGKTGSPDSPKVPMKEYLKSGGSAYCIYNGIEYPPGTLKCMPDDQGQQTWHVCIGGQWVSTGSECDSED